MEPQKTLTPMQTKGNLFDPAGRYHPDAGAYFAGATPDNFADLLRAANGFFAVVLEGPFGVLAAVDRLRSYPLFFANGRAGFDAYALAGATPAFDALKLAEFRSAAFVSGPHTLVEGLGQLQAGQWLHIPPGGKAHVQTYYDHLHLYALTGATQGELLQKLGETAERVFQRLITSAEGRPLVVSLSGGLDSRFVIAMLKRLGYPNLSAFTYGRPGGLEVQTARQVAERLGVPWRFVPYTPDVLAQWFDADGRAYARAAFQLASLPFEQDYFALRALRAVAPEAIIVNGHCGDILAGKRIPAAPLLAKYPPTPAGLADMIYHLYFDRYGRNGRERAAIIAELRRQLAGIPVRNRDELISAHEHWKTLNHDGQYILNSLRCYEHFGFEWRTPLNDAEWLALWYDIPNEWRYDQRLYKLFLSQELFAPMGLDFVRRDVDALFTHGGLWTRLKAMAPRPIRRLLRLLLVGPALTDVNSLDPLRDRLFAETRARFDCRPTDDINTVCAHWMAERAQDFLDA